jgi:hypothetical protein
MALIPLKDFLRIWHFKLIGLIGPRALSERAKGQIPKAKSLAEKGMWLRQNCHVASFPWWPKGTNVSLSLRFGIKLSLGNWQPGGSRTSKDY